eukprot:TRINITY_DN2164_c0_g1_i1.p1 TRINITY_DN2164_c0_g1~~TRINITY_DN2164_c0_g1_i1.p1  ORF type:complete len:511 (-),score=85.91 TRINITY_DN2164_c0_g1_i1:685-2217(-)
MLFCLLWICFAYFLVEIGISLFNLNLGEMEFFHNMIPCWVPKEYLSGFYCTRKIHGLGYEDIKFPHFSYQFMWRKICNILDKAHFIVAKGCLMENQCLRLLAKRAHSSKKYIVIESSDLLNYIFKQNVPEKEISSMIEHSTRNFCHVHRQKHNPHYHCALEDARSLLSGMRAYYNQYAVDSISIREFKYAARDSSFLAKFFPLDIHEIVVKEYQEQSQEKIYHSKNNLASRRKLLKRMKEKKVQILKERLNDQDEGMTDSILKTIKKDIKAINRFLDNGTDTEKWMPIVLSLGLLPYQLYRVQKLTFLEKKFLVKRYWSFKGKRPHLISYLEYIEVIPTTTYFKHMKNISVYIKENDCGDDLIELPDSYIKGEISAEEYQTKICDFIEESNELFLSMLFVLPVEKIEEFCETTGFTLPVETSENISAIDSVVSVPIQSDEEKSEAITIEVVEVPNKSQVDITTDTSQKTHRDVQSTTSVPRSKANRGENQTRKTANKQTIRTKWVKKKRS